jgi:hypothetical protein
MWPFISSSGISVSVELSLLLCSFRVLIRESFPLLRLFEFKVNYEVGVFRSYCNPRIRIPHQSRKTQLKISLISISFEWRQQGKQRMPCRSSSDQNDGVISTVNHDLVQKNCADNGTVPQLSTLRREADYLNVEPTHSCTNFQSAAKSQ